jgi:parallel beta-helix repeat protein
VHATGSGPLRYQWLRAGQPIAGATSASLTVGPLRFGDDVDYTVQVSNDASTVVSNAAAIQISPAVPARPVSDCTDITAPGSYALTSDVHPANRTTACISVHDTHDVQIDCANHKLATDSTDAIKIDRVDHFSLRNCTIDAGWFNLTQSNWGNISANSLASSWSAIPYMAVTATNTDHIVFANNTLVGTYQDWYSSSTTVSHNQIFGSPLKTGPGAILSSWSKHALISGNTIDGRWNGQTSWDGTTMPLGFDDGIIITDLSDVLLENNTIRNVWDSGIEWYGSVSDSVIRGNHVEKAGISAIGGWYYSSVSNVQFLKNTGAEVRTLFYMLRTFGLRPAGTDLQATLPADTEVRFRDNVFDGNVLLPPFSSTSGSIIFIYNKMGFGGGVSSTPGERAIPDSAFNIGNNVFRNNDFGSGVPGPDFGGVGASGIVIDGGGNKCAKPLLANYPLTCN